MNFLFIRATNTAQKKKTHVLPFLNSPKDQFLFTVSILLRVTIGGWLQRPRGLRLGSAAACLLGLQVRIPPGHGYLSVVTAVCCQVEVSLSG